MTGERDLEGLLVVSVEQAVAAPYASSRLADAGARVEIERPDRDFAPRVRVVFEKALRCGLSPAMGVSLLPLRGANTLFSVARSASAN